ncbi:hypothetical protein ACX93W_06960 [Paenibacillus sp. CAU 1782]
MAKLTPAEAKSLLEELCRDAGREAPELGLYIQELERTVRELKLAAVRRSTGSESMNSRLKDALRE